jgi:hypothetical protein
MSAVLSRPYIEFESVLRESEETRVAVLQKLIKALRTFDFEADDDALFCSLFRQAQTVLEMDDENLANQCKVTRTTVNRWVRGITAPHAVMQEAAFRTMARLAEAKVKYHSVPA